MDVIHVCSARMFWPMNFLAMGAVQTIIPRESTFTWIVNLVHDTHNFVIPTFNVLPNE